MYVEFICRLFSERDRSIEADLAGKVYDRFGGHTYYVQKTMNEVFSNTPQGGQCTVETVQGSLQAILNGNDMLYRETLLRMTLRQKKLLYAIATGGRASRITSTAFVKRHKLVSTSSVQSAIKKLCDEEFVVDEMKRYRVSDRFFALWIRRMLSLDD